jgi:hypothetical protein
MWRCNGESSTTYGYMSAQERHDLYGLYQEEALTTEMLDPVRILKEITDYLNEHVIEQDGQLMSLVSFEDPEGDEGAAEARISWGGRDLFDLKIERV